MDDITVTLPMRKYEQLMSLADDARDMRNAVRMCIDLSDADAGRVRFCAEKFFDIVRKMLPARYAGCDITL